ncbi:MAG: phospholipid carrier-dependent glycosyltransferase, partial [Lachnospiraceae bacterium]|nr:phospholipid carrier-dependent glycosyltransferase [Lachnospiraceae bacterium]
LFGMTPFGWRFSGTVTGILMLPLMYLLLTRLFRSEKISLCGTILLSAGFMHYVQTRIATIDSYAVFFILLMYYFMAGWFFDGSKKDLALCGICFGLGASCKWTCLYAGAGLAVLWILYWVYAFADLKGCVSSAEDDAANAEQNRRYRESIRRTAVRFFRNAGFCVLFFVLIPGFIYYLSYYPYGQAQHEVLFGREYNRIVLDNQTFMFHYHSTIEAEHPYSSRWYQWILNIRPILYYLEYLPDNKRVSIAAFVNPVICWGGLLSLPILAYAAVKQKEKKAVFLLIGYASGLLPWIIISRLTFEYHYFASAVFHIPILCYVFCLIGRFNPHGRSYIACFTAMAAVLFALFFPVLAGIPVDNEIGTKIFCWLPSWPI